MQTKNSSTTVLIAIIVLITFPIWIGLIGGIFGLIGGIIGGLFGIIAGIFGAIFGAIGSLFGWMFDWSWNCPFNWNSELWVVLLVVAVIVIATKSRKN